MVSNSEFSQTILPPTLASHNLCHCPALGILEKVVHGT